MKGRRVAVTGIGMISALGVGRERTWTSLVDGVCGIRPLTAFDTEGYRSRCGAEVGAFDLSSLSPLERRRYSRSDQLAILTAAEALEDAGLLASGVDPLRVGVALGAGTGDLFRNEHYYFTLLQRGIEHARPTEIFHHFSSTPTDVVASRFGLGGPRGCFVSACSSSTIAIGQCADAIRLGEIDAALCGGADTLSRLTFSGFNALRLMDAEPCRPFDAGRNGMNIGEGAAVLVLEEMDLARARGARVYAELAGYAVRCEAHHATAPEPEGHAIAAMLGAALDDAGIDPSAVDHVNAHGTATVQNDRAESRGFRAVLGERVARVPVTSIKSMVGHCLGAAGAIEAAATALTIAYGVVPPTIHHERTDPECPVDIVANQAREIRVSCAVSVSLAFGGNDSALVLTAT